MPTQIALIMLVSSVLITIILLAVLLALSFRLGSTTTKVSRQKPKKVSQDLKKIKDQINGE